MALRDGSTVHVRPVQAEDEEGMHVFLESLDPGSRMFRFFSGGTDLTAAAHLMVDVDYARRYGLVAVRERATKWSRTGNYFGAHQGEAEIAFAIAPACRGSGSGPSSSPIWPRSRRSNGISVFTAEVMPENHRMIEVFRESGFPVEMSSRPGSIHVELPTSFSDEAVSHFEDRDRIAAQAAIRPFVEPRAVAVIGASREHGTVGGQLFHNALEAGFEGVVYPVNPSAEVVQSVRAYPSVTEVPDEVDLAVIAVPAPARDRRRARVRGQGGPGARGDLRRLRRDRAGWRRAPGPAGRDLQGGGDATGRARTASGS